MKKFSDYLEMIQESDPLQKWDVDELMKTFSKAIKKENAELRKNETLPPKNPTETELRLINNLKSLGYSKSEKIKTHKSKNGWDINVDGDANRLKSYFDDIKD